MTLRNDEVIDLFVDGKEAGKSNRMAISAFEGWTLLWGYGHALYAARRDDGTLFVYHGWHGYSSSTSRHINLLTATAEKRYGDPQNYGQSISVKIDGEGTGGITESPLTGHQWVKVPEVQVGTSFGKLQAPDRPELADLRGRHVPSPSGGA